ncbi:hypothetical protein [Parasedimentitalea denitrificans]|uniref:hypothetical protein n=1 Tax=Parasedimentitalea denitrificans TaxID=2211118 RepID=UPI00197EF6DA|nr:hypothetical protein [Sedimentitalea sp. CY04]
MKPTQDQLLYSHSMKFIRSSPQQLILANKPRLMGQSIRNPDDLAITDFRP